MIPNSLEELKHLTPSQLPQVATAIRQRILEVLSKNGGHLTSNLGIVELTIALHYVFDSPTDTLIFDVSHQTYPHKILTGRNATFPHIRQTGGVCGFAHPGESSHDSFYAGHAGTALSLGLGVAQERNLTGNPGHVLPILGDASLTCGLTLEALNNIPSHLPRFIAILNDNARSISENVGNLKEILATGDAAAAFFKEFHLSYVGPIDGHDLPLLIETFERLKNQSGPILLHVRTVKGQGLPISLSNPTAYHGARPFDLCSGKFLPAPSTGPTFPKIFGRHLLEMAERDPSLVVITPAMTAGSCLDPFLERFRDRCFDVGIAEGHAVTFAGGLAKGRHLKVFCSIYATFLQRALDNLFQDVCLQELPVVFALDRAFISGPDGSTHHGIYDLAFLNAMPGLIIAQPRNGHLLKELLESSLSWERPGVIRYPNLETEEPSRPIAIRPVGKGEIVAFGSKLLLVALGHHVTTALKIRELLLPLGIEATVVDPIFLKPLDEALFSSLIPSHNYLVTIEEHAVNSGLGAILNQFLIQQGHREIDTLNLGIPDRFLQFGSHRDLLREIGLDAEGAARHIVEHFELRSASSAAMLNL